MSPMSRFRLLERASPLEEAQRLVERKPGFQQHGQLARKERDLAVGGLAGENRKPGLLLARAHALGHGNRQVSELVQILDDAGAADGVHLAIERCRPAGHSAVSIESHSSIPAAAEPLLLFSPLPPIPYMSSTTRRTSSGVVTPALHFFRPSVTIFVMPCGARCPRLR